MIFLIATEEAVSWSFAELGTGVRDKSSMGGLIQTIRARRHLERDGEHNGRVEGESRRTHADGLEVDIAGCDLSWVEGERRGHGTRGC